VVSLFGRKEVEDCESVGGHTKRRQKAFRGRGIPPKSTLKSAEKAQSVEWNPGLQVNWKSKKDFRQRSEGKSSQRGPRKKTPEDNSPIQSGGGSIRGKVHIQGNLGKGRKGSSQKMVQFLKGRALGGGGIVKKKKRVKTTLFPRQHAMQIGTQIKKQTDIIQKTGWIMLFFRVKRLNIFESLKVGDGEKVVSGKQWGSWEVV